MQQRCALRTRIQAASRPRPPRRETRIAHAQIIPGIRPPPQTTPTEPQRAEMHNAHAQKILPRTPPSTQRSAETRTAHEQTSLFKTPPAATPTAEQKRTRRMRIPSGLGLRLPALTTPTAPRRGARTAHEQTIFLPKTPPTKHTPTSTKGAWPRGAGKFSLHATLVGGGRVDRGLSRFRFPGPS